MMGRLRRLKGSMDSSSTSGVYLILAVVLLGQSITAAFVIEGSIAIAGVAVAQFG